MKIMAKAVKLTSARAAKAAFFASLMSAVPASAKTEQDLAQFSDPACGIGGITSKQFAEPRECASSVKKRS